MRFLKAVKSKIISFFHDFGDYLSFAFRATYKGIKQPLKPAEFSEFFFSIGYQSLVVVLFAGFFAGLSQTLFLENELDDYGAKMTIGRVLGVTAVRELGSLVVALMFTGKVGAAITAEIGSMKVNSQVDAIIALGQDPERKLATPRIWGMTMVALPVAVLTTLAVLLGGYLVQTVGSGMFWYQAKMALYFRHYTSLLVKPFVYGWMISTVACYFGLRTSGGVRGVGEAVSKTVVHCCIWIFVLNAIMGTILIMWTGI
jgi:phospholipid/cholesterol/gamma-HCH transport system permease protein